MKFMESLDYEREKKSLNFGKLKLRLGFRVMVRVRLIIRAFDLRLDGHEFDSRPRHCRVTTLGKFFTLVYQAA